MDLKESLQLTEEQRRALGSRILQHRKKRRWSQRELSWQTGIRALRLSKLENGHATPSLAELVQLGEALAASLDELVTGMPPADPGLERRLASELLELEDFATPDECAALGGLLRALLTGLKARNSLQGEAR